MQSKIEQQVMASVAVIHTGRLLVSRIALECYALAMATVALWQFTWVHKVLANFAVVERGGLGSMANYFAYAFLHTHLATQFALVVAAVAAAALVIDTVRSFGTQRLAY
jgi:hypothetical protein